MGGRGRGWNSRARERERAKVETAGWESEPESQLSAICAKSILGDAADPQQVDWIAQLYPERSFIFHFNSIRFVSFPRKEIKTTRLWLLITHSPPILVVVAAGAAAAQLGSVLGLGLIAAALITRHKSAFTPGYPLSLLLCLWFSPIYIHLPPISSIDRRARLSVAQR